MQPSSFTPHALDVIERPQCPRCSTRMWLARIEPDEPGHDRRTFECPQCDYLESIVVKYK